MLRLQKTEVKLLKVLFVVIFLQFFSGYGCMNNRSSSIPQEQVDVNDPDLIRSQLEEKIKEDLERIEPKLEEGMTRMYSDGERVYTAEVRESSYDIKQSDSIVTPYVGMVRYSLDWYNDGNLIENKVYIEANYAYQGRVWNFKEATRYTFLESENGWTPDRDPENIAWFNSLFQ